MLSVPGSVLRAALCAALFSVGIPGLAFAADPVHPAPKPPGAEADDPPELPRAKLDDGVFLQSGDLKIMNDRVERVLLLMLTDEKRKNPRNVPAPDRILQARVQIAQHLLENAAIEKYARDQKLDVKKDDLDKFVEMKKAALQRENKTFEQMLADSGQTEAEFRDFWGAKIAVERDVAAKLTAAEVDAYFEKNMAELPLRSAAHILYQYKGAFRPPEEVTRTKDEAKALAEDTLKQLKAGKDFAELAKNSDDDATRTKGGALSFFSLKGKDKMVDSFGKAVYGLKNVGDFAPVIETQFGFHVIKLTGIRDDEYKVDMRRYLAVQKFDQLMGPLMQKVLNDAKFNEKLTALPTN